MLKNSLITVCTFGLMAGGAFAEEQRTQLTKDNAFPDQGQVEVGAKVDFIEYKDNNESFAKSDANLTRASVYGRYGLTENVVIDLKVPFDDFDPDSGDSESGLGDVEIGLQLRGFEDIFDYPFVIPHVTYDFGNGEDDIPGGSGDDTVTIGISVGTVTSGFFDHIGNHAENKVTWVADLSYDVNGSAENSAVFGLSIIWDLDEQFGIGFEGNIRENLEDEETAGGPDESPALFIGSVYYQATESFEMSFYAGAGKDSLADSIVGVKTSYTF